VKHFEVSRWSLQLILVSVKPKVANLSCRAAASAKGSARRSPAETQAYLLRRAEISNKESPSNAPVTLESRTCRSDHDTPRLDGLQRFEAFTDSDEIAAAARGIIAALQTILITSICTIHLSQEPLLVHVVVYSWETRLGSLFVVPVDPCALGSVDRARRLIALKVWQHS
jgi:hypothetical protein